MNRFYPPATWKDEEDPSRHYYLERALPLEQARTCDEERGYGVNRVLSWSWLQKKKQDYTVRSDLNATLFASWRTILLLPAIPTGFAVKYTNQSPVATFAVNFFAIIPIGSILDVVTEELVIRRGADEGLVLIVTFGNAIQLVITVIALVKGQAHIVRTSLVGAVIANTVLMVGLGFFLGGLRHQIQKFNRMTTGSTFNELVLSIGALLIPTAMAYFQPMDPPTIAKFSRAESILLLLSYICYLVYCHKTHKKIIHKLNRIEEGRTREVQIGDGDATRGIATMGASMAASAGGTINRTAAMRQIQHIPLPKISSRALVITLILDTVLLGFCTTFAVDSIDGLTQKTILTKDFIGLILLPILSCNLHAIRLAIKNKMADSFAINVGSSIQLLLCILPLAVIIDWIRNDPLMTLVFDRFQVVSLIVSTMILKYITNDGKSNWLEGLVLIALYAIIALNAWFAPEQVLRP